MNLVYEPKKILDVTKSQTKFKRALEIIPAGVYGHQGPSEGCMIPVSVYPLYTDHAQGTYLWDIDGNRIIDLMCAFGPNYLGYNDPDVDAAAAAQRKKCDVTSLVSEVSVEFAEEIIKTINQADWAFYCKNGTDVTTFGVLIARAHTGRKKIVMTKGWYHGVAPWTQRLGYSGIIEEDVCNNLYINWNHPEEFEALCQKYPNQIAGFISQPYQHGNFCDQELPSEDYWKKIRAICDKYGVILIMDDVRAGFRIDFHGSDYHYGIKSDLSCFCKAIANGYNVSVLTGRKDLMYTAADIAYTGSYWFSSVPFAAGVATLRKARELNATEVNNQKGKKLTDGFKEVAKDNGFDLVVTGVPAMFYLRLANDLPSRIVHQDWVAEMVKRGVYVTSHHNHFINYALSDDDIQYCWEAADESYKVLRKRYPQLNFIK